MLIKGSFVTAASGKLGGVVAARNKGGQYLRAYAMPVNPSTPFQEVVRNAIATLTSRWTSVVTLNQRAAWATFAQNITITNPLGDTGLNAALGWYCACNVPRIQAGVTVVDAGPTIYTLATLTPPVCTITAAGTTVSVAFTNTDGWANEAGGYMLVYASRPQSPGINFFAGPYRFAGKITGAATPPTSPSVITLPFPSGPTGSKQFFQVRSVRADGRISAPFRLVSTV
jgi:hypothetical protein